MSPEPSAASGLFTPGAICLLLMGTRMLRAFLGSSWLQVRGFAKSPTLDTKHPGEPWSRGLQPGPSSSSWTSSGQVTMEVLQTEFALPSHPLRRFL